MTLDILIRIRDQLLGLTRTREGMAGLRQDIERTNTAADRGSGPLGQLSKRFLGVGAAVLAVQSAVRGFYRSIEESDRTDAAAEGARRLADNVGAVQAAAVEATGGILAFAGEVSSFAARVVPGAGQTAEALRETKESAENLARVLQDIGTRGKERLRELAEQTARAREEQQRLAQAARDTEAALLRLADAWGAEALVGEASGDRAMRLRREAASLEQMASLMGDEERAAVARERAARMRTEARGIELSIVQRLHDAEAERQRIADSTLSSVQRLQLVEAEIEALARSSSARAAADTREQEIQAAELTRLNELERERLSIKREIAAEEKRAEEERKRREREPPGRDDLRGQIEWARQALPTLAETAGDAVISSYGGMVRSIYDGLDGLWNRTMDLGDAFVSVARGFANSMLRAFGEMVAQYAAKKAMMFVIDQAYAAKGLALQAAQAAKTLVMWIPSAIAAAISSFGVAAALGVAAVVAALAAFGGFAEGGYTGGQRGRPAGIVHGEEFVFSAPAVDAIGAGRLGAMHDAALAGAAPVATAAAGGGGGGGGGGGPVHVAIFDRKTSAEDYLNSAAGDRWFMDRYRQAQQRIG